MIVTIVVTKEPAPVAGRGAQRADEEAQPYHIILHYTILYYIMLYYIILYYSIAYNVV